MNGYVKRIEALELQHVGDRCLHCLGLHELAWLRNMAEKACTCLCCPYLQALADFAEGGSA